MAGEEDRGDRRRVGCEDIVLVALRGPATPVLLPLLPPPVLLLPLLLMLLLLPPVKAERGRGRVCRGGAHRPSVQSATAIMAVAREATDDWGWWLASVVLTPEP